MDHVGGAKKREKTTDELADELSKMFNVATRINKRQSDRSKKVPEFFKPAVAKSPKKRAVGVSMPKKTVKLAPKAKAGPSNALAIVPVSAAAAPAGTSELPEGFASLMQYDPKLNQFRARIHRRDQTAFAPAEAYQLSKVEAAQTILTQELNNLQSLRDLILKKRDEIVQAAATAPETSRAAEARAAEAARLAAIEEEYGPAPTEEVLSDYSMGSLGSRKSSRSSPNARAAAASGPLMLMPPPSPARDNGPAPMEGGRRKKK